MPQLKHQHKKIEAKMLECGVEMRLGKADHYWMDYGFDYVKRECNDNELISVFDVCHILCHEV